MAAPRLTPGNFADYLASYRSRLEQRRRALESQPHGKHFAPGQVSQPSKDFWEAVSAVRARAMRSNALRGTVRLPDAADNATLVQIFNRAMNRLGREWLDSARRGDTDAVGAFLEEGFPITYQDRLTGETALHAAAGSQARSVVRVLLPLWPDFLIRDRQGRLASELAYVYGEDPALAHLLRIKERKEAIASGRNVSRRPAR